VLDPDCECAFFIEAYLKNSLNHDYVVVEWNVQAPQAREEVEDRFPRTLLGLS
jgi:hypothetical protein